MKLTKKLQAEILKSYKEYWKANLRGDTSARSSWLHDNFQMIGTARGEFFDNKKKSLKYFGSTADQIAGKLEMRNRKISLSLVGDEILVNEKCDFFVLIDSAWTFYDEGRISILFTHTKEGWRIILEHTSIPDARTSEGDQINTDKIKAENIRLKNAVKRRTIELEEKNRELEIEAALERVRARTMAMHKSDELSSVASVLFHQLQELDLPNLRRCLIGIVNEKKGRLQSWHTSLHGDSTHKVLDYPINEHPVIRKKIKGWKKQEPFSIELSPATLKDFIKYIVKHGFGYSKGEKPATVLIQNHAPFKYGYLEVATHEPISDQDLQLLQRFAKVFEQTYTRFLDLQKAEAQAREAEIELGLERVRARGMAMQTSDEVAQLIGTLFKELTKLDLVLTRCIIWIFDPKTYDAVWWMANSEDPSRPMSYLVPYHTHKPWLAFFNEWKKRTRKWIYDLKGKTKKDWDDYLFSRTGLSKMPKFIQKGMRAPDRVLLSASFNNFGGMNVASLEPLSDEHFNILLRFAKVFDQTYTRFLDLLKAEAQAREAEIQLALERVRSAAMAMHSSDELSHTIKVLLEQLNILGINPINTYLVLYDLPNNQFSFRMTGKRGSELTEMMTFSFDKLPGFKGALKAWKSGAPVIEAEYLGDDRKKWLDLIKPMNAKLSQGNRLSLADFPNGLYSCSGRHEFGSLGILKEKKASEEEKNLLVRFAKEFNQTYTRFLDLQKAEAQAREAEIQLALERVRARTMAMHSSAELAEAASVLFQQIIALDLKPSACGVVIVDEKAKTGEVFITADGTVIPDSFILPYHGEPAQNKIFSSWKKKEPYTIVYLKGEKLNSHLSFIAKNMPVGDMLEASGDRQPDQLALHIIHFKHGFLGINYPEPNEGVVPLLIRFAKVFEQTYTRFLDLQKAETQAREGQIQLALERVRARTMAMQKSDELRDAASVLFLQLKDLGIDAWTCGYNIWMEDKKTVMAWLSSGVIQPSFKLPLTENPTLNHFYEAAQRGESLFVEEINGEAINELYRYLGNIINSQGISGEVRRPRATHPSSQVNNVAYFSYGFLLFVTYEQLPEAHDAFKRFAKVFEQTYTRFLDLQRSEAQARESQIQLALERVRARTMAMQHSKELAEIAVTIHKELVALGFTQFLNCGYVEIDERNKIQHGWSTNQDGGLMEPYHLPLSGEPALQNRYDAWKRKEKLFCQVLGGKDLKRHIGFASPHLGSKQVAEMVKKFFPDPTIFYCANFSHGYLSIITGKKITEEEETLLIRFTKEFEQTYARFLDLQKAEAQARESQIEAALEKIRSRSLAMHQSNELKDVIAIFFEKLNELNVLLGTIAIQIFDHMTSNSFLWVGNAIQDPQMVKLPYHEQLMQEDNLLKDMWQARSEEKDIINNFYSRKQKDKFFNHVFRSNDFTQVPESARAFLRQLPNHIACLLIEKNSALLADSFTGEFFTDEKVKILKRAAKVFEQAYIRFLDLQKAEAQAREAEIQLALERVRARTMAMHKSEELQDVASLLYKEFQGLGVTPFLNCGYVEVDEENKTQHGWMTSPDGTLMEKFNLPLTGEPAFQNRYDAWKNQEPVFHQVIGGSALVKHIQVASRHFGSEEVEKMVKSRFPDPTIFYCGNFSKGYLHLVSGNLLTKDEESLLERFTRAFEMTYKRFLDLQKAETQAREAQIEASLERVRAKAMAMHSSKDISETVVVFFKELKNLGISPIRCGVGQIDEASRTSDYSVTTSSNGEDSYEVIGKLKLAGHQVLDNIFTHWQKQEEYFPVLKGNELTSFYNVMNPQVKLPDYPEDIVQYGSYFYFKEGLVFAWTEKELSDEEIRIFRRLTSVISLTYRRYIDLQNAEAQAREAQIEAALERVRSKAMAMHNSDDLPSTVIIAFTELKKLGFIPMRCGISLQNKENRRNLLYAATSNEDGDSLSVVGWAILDDHPVLAEIYNKWMQGEDYFPTMKGQLLLSYYEKIKDTFKIPVKYTPDQEQFGYFMYFTHGTFYGWCDKAVAEEDKRILRRFASVVDLTFKRYFDLQKAEAQAREAKIEAAMEKVRARAMAMQKPEELVEVARVLRAEMGLLGVEELETSSIYIHNETTGKTECWFAIQDQQEKKLVADHMYMDLNDTWVGREMLSFYHSDEKHSSVLMQGEARKEWINYCAKQSALFGSSGFYGENIPDRTYHLYKFSSGFMGAASPGEISSESWDLLKRATKVFSLAYTRFSDLQKAEASAREAIKQAALDRIRADIASMRTISDLDRITPLIWNELTILGIPFIRCGVFIMDDTQNLVHTFLSTPDGKAIAAFHLPYDTPGNLRMVIDNWHHNEQYIDHWNEEDFTQFAEILVNQGALESAELYLKTIPHGGFYLHFLPFLQGMLYVGNTESLSDDAIKLIQAVADAFSTAYARYEDFTKLEAAKKQVDNTLNELQAAQKQLIQSEKMASLGELTAGIAHEIQNPLNFVNNFSDVSNELLEEMKGELAKGNSQQAIELADEVRQNLEKILTHGKRADGIVKGMLQHSRTSSGQKELTDINMLADEYLRLAYHGLRAKDKSFNAKFETDFDTSIEKINVVSQEIGRVILNLINNAFYAVSEKAKRQSASGGYEPRVIVETKKINDKSDSDSYRNYRIQISVKDNGNGIPDSIKEKIFQPFFTTKPTGQGTGLGLSLSYDIVKAHGGEIKVESKESVGTEFKIILPGNSNNDL